jgi:hypothetical protein
MKYKKIKDSKENGKDSVLGVAPKKLEAEGKRKEAEITDARAGKKFFNKKET